MMRLFLRAILSGSGRGVYLALTLMLTGVALSTFSAPAEIDLSGYPWLYEREKLQPTVGPEVATVLLVGDVMLGRGVGLEADPLGSVSRWLHQPDLVIGNLEGVLASPNDPLPVQGGGAPGRPIPLLMPFGAADSLALAGFDVLGLANNHALDAGEEGLRETVARLAAVGIDVAGVGPAQNQAWAPTYHQIRGMTLAILAVNAVPVPGETATRWGPAKWDPALAKVAIEAAAARSDAVIVSIHWGYEYQTSVDPAQRAIAESLLSAGADLIVGHHPHVVQGTRITPAGGFVAYSLGNFVFDQFEEATRQGLALRAMFDSDGLLAVQALPVRAGPRPALLAPEAASALFARVEPATWRVAFHRVDGVWHQVAPPHKEPSGLFVSGAIDLTGDGVPERVFLNQGSVTIEQAGELAWKSPSDWNVLDLALGDPNDDGRYEVLLAMEKLEANGTRRSHPFIIGYRAGIYQTVWGGSAVGDPILEIELHDVDGDGAQELIVLDAAGQGGETAVSVWDWHGWGFSQAWRSPEGRYRDLVVQESLDTVISVRAMR